jgi:hypothetical protein
VRDRAFFPGARIEGNALADADPGRYPEGNCVPSSAEFRAQFVAYAAGDYRLTPNSVWRGAGTDGRDLGASFDAAAADRSFLARPKEGVIEALTNGVFSVIKKPLAALTVDDILVLLKL